MLSANKSLKELYLRWNNITNCGGVYLLLGVGTKRNLAILDLSWNNLKANSKLFDKKLNKRIAIKLDFITSICDMLPKLKDL